MSYWYTHIDTLIGVTNTKLLYGDVPMAKFMMNLLKDKFKFDPFSYNKCAGDITEWCVSRLSDGRGVNSVHLREYLQETLPEELEDELEKNKINMNKELEEVNIFFKRDKIKEVNYNKVIEIPELKDRQILYDKYLDGNPLITTDDENNLEYWLKQELTVQNVRIMSARNLLNMNANFYKKIEKIILEKYNSEKYVSHKRFMDDILKKFYTKKSVNDLLESINDVLDGKLNMVYDIESLKY